MRFRTAFLAALLTFAPVTYGQVVAQSGDPPPAERPQLPGSQQPSIIVPVSGALITLGVIGLTAGSEQDQVSVTGGTGTGTGTDTSTGTQ